MSVSLPLGETRHEETLPNCRRAVPPRGPLPYYSDRTSGCSRLPFSCSTCLMIKHANSIAKSTPISPSAGEAQTRRAVTIRQSHGGSGKQARAVIDGLQADVVTRSLFDLRHRRDLSGAKVIAPNWRARLPNNSAPYYSTIVFLSPQGQSKKITRTGMIWRSPGVSRHPRPTPRHPVGARWNYLAARGAYAQAKYRRVRPQRRSSS